MIVIGIDQGVANVGYAVLNYQSKGDFQLLESGAIKTKPNKELEERIGEIYKRVDLLIQKYKPTHMGCERFFFNASDKTMKFRSATIVRTNMVSGVLFLLAHQHRMSIKDYVPGTIKKHVTGDGRASKEEVIQSIQALVTQQGQAIALKNDHEADAIAIALAVGDEAKKIKEDEEWTNMS